MTLLFAGPADACIILGSPVCRAQGNVDSVSTELLVPEPGGVALFGAGLAALGLLRRRKA